jgi:hypothetical protein
MLAPLPGRYRGPGTIFARLPSTRRSHIISKKTFPVKYRRLAGGRHLAQQLAAGAKMVLIVKTIIKIIRLI